MNHILIAGIGCRRGCAAQEIVELVQQAAMQSGLMPQALAVPVFKSSEAGIAHAAHFLGLPMLTVSNAALQDAQPRCATLSLRAQAATGVASVAEGSALAAAGPASVLVLPRIASANATCALARTEPAP